MWAIVDSGRIISTYHHEASAILNAKGRTVEQVSADDPRLFQRPDPDPPANYAAARRREYARIDLGDQLEIVSEGLFAILSGQPVPQATMDKMQALSSTLAAIKAAHPKP
jgi:hypothetical protein